MFLSRGDFGETEEEIDEYMDKHGRSPRESALLAGRVAAGETLWGGLYSAVHSDALAADAVILHTDEQLWSACSEAGRRLHGSLFETHGSLDSLRDAVNHSFENARELRAGDYLGASLWHHRQRSTEYFSKWIELKEELKELKAAQKAEQQGSLIPGPRRLRSGSKTLGRPTYQHQDLPLQLLH